MLKIVDNLRLSTTKFKAKKIRSIVSILLISLVVAVVVGFWVILPRFLDSLKSFSNEGLNGRNAVYAYNSIKVLNFANPPKELVDIASNKYNIAKKTDSSVQNPVTFDEYSKINILDNTNPISIDAGIEYMNSKFPKTSREDFEKILKKYNHSKHIKKSDYDYGGILFGVIENGKESIASYDRYSGSDIAKRLVAPSLVESNLKGIFPIDDSKLKEDEIPIMFNYKTAAKYLNIPEINNPTQKQIFERNDEIRKKVSNLTFEACLRNSESYSAITVAQNANKDINSEVKYKFDDNCGNPKIIKGEDQGQIFAKSLKKAFSKKVKFRAVGVVPDHHVPSGNVKNIENLISSLSVSTIDSYEGRAIIPFDIVLEKNNEDIISIFKQPKQKNELLLYDGEVGDYIEFPNVEEMNKFVKEVNCEEYCGKEKSVKVAVVSDNATVLNEIRNSFTQIGIWVIIGAIVIVSVIIYITVNRIMVDSRKETAVFRAIGFSRVEIAQIYIGYVFVFSMIIAIISNLILFVLGVLFESKIESEIGLYFSNFFMLEKVRNFNIFDYDISLSLVIVPVFGLGIIASLIPLLSNSRRSPLKNLRSE